MKKNYFSTAISIVAIALAIVTKYSCNKKYDELNKLIVQETKSNKENSETSVPDQRNIEAKDMSVDKQAEELLGNTAICEYLDIVRSEYEIERNKKQSFENRAGLIMALVGATCIFVFEQVDLHAVFSLMFETMSFFVLIRIISGLGVYIGFGYTMVMIIKTISIKQHNNFEVKSIDEELLGEHRVSALVRIIKTYRDITIQHRDLNEKRAKTFNRSLYGVIVTFVAVVIYINLL